MTSLSPSVASDRRNSGRINGDANRLQASDRPAHDWYRFVLSFPPHLVRDYAKKFALSNESCVLDPFCGTGTTVVECKKMGIQSVGVEAHPMSYFASSTKTDWNPVPRELLAHARQVASQAEKLLSRQGISDDSSENTEIPIEIPLRALPPQTMKLLLSGSISPLPLHKTLVLLECLTGNRDDHYYGHERLALAKALVTTIGNLHFGPEVGVTKPKHDVPVISAWLDTVVQMAADIEKLKPLVGTSSTVHCADSRQIREVLKPCSIDAVITSPPYPNEKDYTRTTRLESVLLGFLHDRDDLQRLKRKLVRSNTRTVYKGDSDDQWIASFPVIQEIAAEIEARRVAQGKTSGFERLYSRVTKLYFGGMAQHLDQLRTILKPGARLAYVVGDQASYLRVMIRTGQILGEIARALGYELEGIDLFRTRLATATMQEMREEVVVLRWPG